MRDESNLIAVISGILCQTAAATACVRSYASYLSSLRKMNWLQRNSTERLKRA